MESKLLISKREKLRLGGGGGAKRGTQRFVVAGLDRGHHPTPYFAFTMFPRDAAECLYLGVLRQRKQQGGKWRELLIIIKKFDFSGWCVGAIIAFVRTPQCSDRDSM